MLKIYLQKIRTIKIPNIFQLHLKAPVMANYQNTIIVNCTVPEMEENYKTVVQTVTIYKWIFTFIVYLLKINYCKSLPHIKSMAIYNLIVVVVVVVVLLFNVHGKHLRSCWDGQLT